MLKPLALSSIIGSIDITSPSIIVAALQILLTSTAYFNEKTNQTPYSKFAIGKNNNISSKFGMLIIYVPALCYCIYNTILKIPNINNLSLPSIDYSDRGLLIAIMLTIHFLKRTLETLFLHKYSGGTSLSTSISIGIYYTLVSVIVSYFSSLLPLSLYNQRTSIVGIIFFVIGQLGNFYHHYLLANLRKTTVTNDKESITKNYKVPRGNIITITIIIIIIIILIIINRWII